MRQKINILVCAIFLLFLLGFITWLGCGPGEESRHFERLPFRSVQKSRILHFDKVTYRWGERSGRKLPYFSSIVNGVGIRFRERGVLRLKPGITGEKGLFFCLDAIQSKKTGFSLTFTIKRREKVLFFQVIPKKKKRKFRFVYSKSRKFDRDDEISIEASGEGVMVVSNAFIYDLLEKPERKFVFVIGLDTKRWDKIGRMVNGVELTPYLNRFRDDAVTFDNAFAQGCWTLPSFTSFFTGLYEFNHRIDRNHVLDSGVPFLIESFARSYLTASINGGFWLSGRIGNARGFDFYQYGSRTRDVFASREMFKNSKRFIQENPVPSLFLFMHTYAIHAPYEPPENFLLRLNQKPLFRKHGTFTLKNQFQKNIPPAVRGAMQELYDADIMAFDFYFGKFIGFLKMVGIYDQSLIVFFSDHGEEFYEHRGWSHGHSLYNELIRVPLMIKFPANQYRKKRIKKNVGVVDILPTLLDFLQIEQKNKIDGCSLMGLIKRGDHSGKERNEGDQGDSQKRRFLISSSTTCGFFEQVPKKVAIFHDRYKLIYNFPVTEAQKAFFKASGMPPEVPRFQIFDMRSDPLEKQDIYPANMDLVILFRKKLDEILKKVRSVLREKKTGEIDFSEEDLKELKTLGYLQE